MLRTLRQPRYAALGALMLLVAIVCVAAGTWQIARYEQKHHANDDLRANAHAATLPVAAVLPLVGDGSAPASRAVEFRSVRATGTFDEARKTLVRNRTLGDNTGYLVLTPFHTSGGTLLVVRGFAAQLSSGGTPVLPDPPGTPVTITARAQVPESRDDAAGQLAGHQVESINPQLQADRLGGAVYNGYAALEAGQPGTHGLRAVPRPDLSNPAGGALEPQHFAYVIQWYLFALLALAAPVAMARSETRRSPEDEFDSAPAVSEPELTPESLRAAKLADRYGRAVH